MHIKEIILEGFKSYSGRTIIKGFDPQFNAITGLNGSGKSNILDAILFVLGLSKNLEIELIYKSGHAGITKAEVTIIFNNRDKINCPPGYDTCDEIIVTRQIQDDKSKYFVNGSIKTVKVVKDMFRNIQLNIETPHFFVGQGRITKIINLNQQELINMLEETAGTSLYNKKKSDCVSLMQRKEDKIKEINELINQEITPQLDKLQKDRDQYFVWKSGEQELHRMLKMLKSFEYYDRSNKCKHSSVQLDQTLAIDADKTTEKRETARQIKIIQEEIEKNQSKYSTENNKQFEKITKKLQDIKKDQTIKQSEIKNRRKQIDEGEKDIEVFMRQIQQHKINLERVEQKLNFEKQDLSNREVVYTSKKEQQDEAKRNAENFKQGNNSMENIKDQLNEQLQTAKKNKNAITSEIQKIKMKMNKTQSELGMVEENLKAQSNQGTNKVQEMKILEKEADSLENEINGSNFNENELNQVRDQLRNMENDMMQATHRLQDFYRQQGNYIFKLEYKDPEPNFDRSKVKGKLFSLFNVKDAQFTKALEIGAGSKLNQIVIENEKVGQALFNKHCFNYPVTFIPLNKIIGRDVPNQVLQSARQIASELKGDILNPIEAIEYKREFHPAIQYTFGSFIICSSNEIAKRIAYHSNQSLRYKCVTQDGDVFDPSGTLTGGFTNNNNMILFKVKSLNDINKEINDLKVKNKTKMEQYEQQNKEKQYLDGLRQDLENKRYKLDKLQKDQKRPEGMNLQERQQVYTDQLKDFKENLQKMIQQETVYQDECVNVTNEMKNLEGQDINNMKDLWSGKVKKIGQEIQNQEKQIHQIRDSINKFDQEKENSSKEILQMGGKIGALEVEIDKNNKLIQVQQVDLDRINSQYTVDKREKDELERQIHAVDNKLKELDAQKGTLQTDLEAIEEELKKILSKQQKYNQEIKLQTDKINDLKRENPFIQQEKDLFGVLGSEYDYTNFDFEEYVKNYDIKKNDNEKMQKKVNFKVEANIENMENKFKELIKNKQEVENDKSEIVNNMKELDIKKQETLEKCYLSVSKSFGTIFSDLLKGAQAKICKIEGKDISDGIELSVKFGGKWKNSLTELSGGQRSLLALSFVLALLLYKPAPFYILDEVDAALDLSHTENIGHMISNNFPQSQFIIISHKDGMYQNANVLFKTSVVDGNSQVERYDFKNKRKDRAMQKE